MLQMHPHRLPSTPSRVSLCLVVLAILFFAYWVFKNLKPQPGSPMARSRYLVFVLCDNNLFQLIKGYEGFKLPSEMYVAHIAATRSLRCSHIADHARERAWHGSGDRRGLREPRSKILARRVLSFEQLLSINDAWRHACTWLMSYCLGLSVKCQDVL